MSINKVRAAIATYALIAIFTWGNALVHFEVGENAKVQECKNQRERNKSFCDILDNSVEKAFASTIFWPLYWSYRLQRSAE